MVGIEIQGLSDFSVQRHTSVAASAAGGTDSVTGELNSQEGKENKEENKNAVGISPLGQVWFCNCWIVCEVMTLL